MFDFRFFHESVSLEPFRIFAKIRGDIRNLCLSPMPLNTNLEETYSWKNLKSKISYQPPFNEKPTLVET